MKKAILPLSFLIVIIVSAIFVFFPHELWVESNPKKVVFHDREKHELVKISVENDDAIDLEIRRFFAENRNGWRVVIRQFSLGETAPSIEIFGADNSYSLGIWREEAVLGFPQTEKSYRKRINPEIHAKLVALIREKELLSSSSPRGAETVK